MFLSLTTRYLHQKLTTINIKNKYDVVVIGGGIIGTAVARKFLLECPGQDICLLEKECSLAKHQSSHNSGVMHCGVFYKPNSLKANLCVEGIELLKKYCDDKNIQYQRSGKVVIAPDLCQVNVLCKLYEQGQDNKVRGLQLLESQREIRKYSPSCKGEKALWCPDTANVNFREVTEHLADDFIHSGGNLVFNYKVVDIKQSEDSCFPICLCVSERPPLFAKYVVVCGGLHSETLSDMLEVKNSIKHQQFLILKVNYQEIDSKYCENLQTNVYGVPDLELPFLGAHFSPQIKGTILLGPSAVPALKVEGYCNDEVSLSHLSKMVFSCNVRNMVVRNFSQCINQLCHTLNTDIQIKYLQQFIPNFSYQYVIKGPTAVQCQLLNSDGTFVDDYIFNFFNGNGIGKRIINLKYTPSPAATSCLSIADYVYKKFTECYTDL
ncbi:hypothetical protein GWI33_000228 [Rhynchophorus ferrugineus]|uniref:L-2-hydroxyglutarate dehydrogenase, mitochondrial n=1 Tax=Rhynchophorus ferrugineus TaxID=354439 RepID=A0A834MNQ3_RHYFE|nr:hypothetical protein GWI33_000228 [Rhynchophorus ferrugineus]